MPPPQPEPTPAPPADRDAARDELLPHLDAAYNLARWLTRNDHDAADVVQESFLRAVRFIAQRRTGSARAWLLQIVRNTSHTWLARNRTKSAPADMLDHLTAPDSTSPDLLLQRRHDADAVRRAIELLPDEFRETIVLREIEGLPYREIAQVLAVPVGTVMSRLSRARERLKELLADYHAEVSHEL
jgi:RNA polymerase sigma-70 factor (ECF subfamily)